MNALNILNNISGNFAEALSFSFLYLIRFSVNTPELNYQKLGEQGQAILLLHGWQRNLSDFIPLAKILASDYQVYALDLPGFGLSALPSEDWDTQDYSDAVLSFIKDKNLHPVIIGHSFGGRIALKLSAQNPDSVSALILIGTPGLPQKTSLLKKTRLTIIKTLGKLFKFTDKIFGSGFFIKIFSPRFGSADYLQAGALRKILIKTVNEDLSGLAVRISCPTLLLWGSKDNEAPLSNAYGYQHLINQSELVLLPQHGHDPHTDVGAHLCYKKIISFLNSHA